MGVTPRFKEALVRYIEARGMLTALELGAYVVRRSGTPVAAVTETELARLRGRLEELWPAVQEPIPDGYPEAAVAEIDRMIREKVTSDILENRPGRDTWQ